MTRGLDPFWEGIEERVCEAQSNKIAGLLSDAPLTGTADPSGLLLAPLITIIILIYLGLSPGGLGRRSMTDLSGFAVTSYFKLEGGSTRHGVRFGDR